MPDLVNFLKRDTRKWIIIAILAAALLNKLGFMPQYLDTGLGKIALMIGLGLSLFWISKTM